MTAIESDLPCIPYEGVHHVFFLLFVRVGRKPSETDSTKSHISSKISRGIKDSTKRRHQRHHQQQPGEQLFPIQVVTV